MPCACGGRAIADVPCERGYTPTPRPDGGLALSLTRSTDRMTVQLGEPIEIALTVTNLSPVPVTATVTDLTSAGLAYDGTGVAVNGVASSDLDITQGVDVGVLGVGETAVVRYNAVAQAVGVQCGTATASFAPFCPDGVARTFARAVSNSLCLSVQAPASRPFGQYCAYYGEQA